MHVDREPGAARRVHEGGRVRRRLAQALLVGTLAGLVALSSAQRWLAAPWPLLELTRYLPFYWLALPCALALALGIWLRGRWAALGLLAPLLLGGVTMAPSFGGGRVAAAAGPAAAALDFRLMTYNVKAAAALHAERLDRIAAEVARVDPDLLVLQDADGLRVRRDAPADVGGPPLFGLPHVYALGQYVVATRLPLLGCEPGRIGYRDESHRYLRCRVEVRGRPVTIVTAHFRSPRGGLAAARYSGPDGVSEWEQNFADRLAQADALAQDLARITGPLVVAGDLNAPEASPVVRALVGTGLVDAHSAAGLGYGYTYGQSFRRGISFLRIDHVLVGGGIRVRRCEVGGGDASEHRPVIADLELGPRSLPPRLLASDDG